MWNLLKNVGCVQKAYSRQKMFTNGLNIGLQWRTWVKKTVHGVETLLSGKDKVPGPAVSKEGYAAGSCDMKALIIMISLKKVQI